MYLMGLPLWRVMFASEQFTTIANYWWCGLRAMFAKKCLSLLTMAKGFGLWRGKPRRVAVDLQFVFLVATNDHTDTDEELRQLVADKCRLVFGG